MVDDATLPVLEARGARPHQDARQLVRLVQCPCCSKPYTSPVTLPCGHTVCRRCLPEPRARNISYPNTPEDQLGVACPTCGQIDSAADCNVDVTFAKIMELIESEVADHTSRHNDSPTLLQEIIAARPGDSIVWSEKSEKSEIVAEVDPPQARCGSFHGGRLASTYIMAGQGLLSFSSGVAYRSQSTAGDDFEHLDTELLHRLQKRARREMDCLVCYNTMLRPTTTPCGHTFCRHCLIRVMDHSTICSVCRRELHIPRSLAGHPNNLRLDALMNSLFPDLMAGREHALRVEERPGEAELDTPIFVCCLSLPTMPTFLYVFEPRYRLMFRRCMEGNQRFGMVMFNRAHVQEGLIGGILEYGTMMQVVNSQVQPNGESYVLARGLYRFRIRAHGMRDGYNIARVEHVDDVSLGQEKRLEIEDRASAQAFAASFNAQLTGKQLTPLNYPDLLSTHQIFQRCRTCVDVMRRNSAPWLSESAIRTHGPCPDDPALFPYWFASVLPIDEKEKYELLPTTSVRERLKIVFTWVRKLEVQSEAAGSSCSIQ